MENALGFIAAFQKLEQHFIFKVLKVICFE